MTVKVDLREDFFPEVGKSLHAWGFVELEVANLYMILQGIKRDEFSHPSRASFEVVVSLEVRLAMITAYVEADPQLQEYLPHAKSLCSRVFKLYKKRHEIAHFLVASEVTENGLVPALRPFVTMYGFSKKRLKLLTIAQIQERRKNFNVLADRIRQHVQHVGSLRKLPAEYYAREGDIAFPPLEPEDLNPKLPALQPQS